MYFFVFAMYLFHKIYTIVVCFIFGKKIGIDQYKNLYYVLSLNNALGKKRRICIYNGIPEGTKIPPVWSDWINYRTDNIPSSVYTPKYPWIMSSLPTLTFSKYKYRQKTSSKYQEEYDIMPQLKTKLRFYKPWSPD